MTSKTQERRQKRKLRKNITLNIEQRQQRVTELYCAEWTQFEIAQELKVSQPTVCNDIAAIREKMLANSLTNMTERLAKELAKLDNLERIALAAWERSCEDAEEVTTTKSPKRGLSIKLKKGQIESVGAGKADKPTVTQEITKIKGQCGNPAFLAEARACAAQRCKLLGMTDDRAVNVNQNTQSFTYDSLLCLKSDPQLAEKRVPRLADVDDPLEVQLKELEKQAESVQP